MAVVWKIRGRMNAEKEFDNLVKFNKGRGGQYRYVYMKMLSDGAYEIGLLQKRSESKKIIKQEKL